MSASSPSVLVATMLLLLLICMMPLSVDALNVRDTRAKNLQNNNKIKLSESQELAIKELARRLNSTAVMDAMKHTTPSLSHDFYDICDQVSGALGYPCEHHSVQTADGFLLDVIRIPPKQKINNATGKPTPAVILQHGLLDSAVTWVANAHPYQNLGCILHDEGYDVWMPNSRGNHYSMANIHYKPYTNKEQDTAYWESIDCDQMGMYDLPANVRYVLNATGVKTVSYVGHSQGTYQAFAAFSTTALDVVDKVNFFGALAPVAWVGHVTALLLKIIAELDVGTLIAIFGFKEFLSNDWLLREISKVCPVIGHDCGNLLEVFFGAGNPANSNATQLQTILRYDPGGTSVNNMIHWQQEIDHNDFAMHDYGKEQNEKKYGQSTPPKYNLHNFVAPPTALFAGDRDALADPADVEQLISATPVKTLVNITYVNDYAHMDFVWGLNAHTILYPKVIALVNHYNPLS